MNLQPRTRIHCRRKFISQTSDNMGRWKSTGGKSQRGEEKKWEDQRRERVRRKKMQVRKKVGKSWFTGFFEWFVALEGRKLGSLKRRVRSHVVRRDMKNCTPLWRKAHFQVKLYKITILGSLLEVEMSKECAPLWSEAHFQVKMYKTHQRRTTLRSWDVEKMHTVVARSTFPSQKCKKLTVPDHFRTWRCRKSARCCGAKHISKS